MTFAAQVFNRGWERHFGEYPAPTAFERACAVFPALASPETEKQEFLRTLVAAMRHAKEYDFYGAAH